MQAEDGGDAPSVASQARGTTPGSKMPRYSTFTQQEMWACRPVLTPAWAVGIFMLLGVIFIPLGAASLSATRSVVEVSQRYDADCISGTTSAAREQTLMDQGGNGVTCNVTLTAPSKMEHPVFMYYEIKGMYQNHRRYVSSRSDPQMRGVGITTKTLKDCKPELDYPDLSDVPAEDRGQLIVPCGLIAWSMFNDTYRVYKGSQIDASQELTSPTLTSSGIAWPSDKDKRYSDITGNSNIVPALRGGESITGQLNQNEHLMVWMRTATTPRFRKLWAIINTDFQKGDQVTVFIENKYNTYRFNGEKSIVLSTSSWMGGANDTVGIICLVVGCLSVLCSIVFFTLVNVHPRKVGDLAFLSWNQTSPSRMDGRDTRNQPGMPPSGGDQASYGGYGASAYGNYGYNPYMNYGDYYGAYGGYGAYGAYGAGYGAHYGDQDGARKSGAWAGDPNLDDGIPVCMQYRRGHCTYGDRCKYRHEGAPGGMGMRPKGAVADDGTPICIQFRQGNCTYGARCKYKHEDAPAAFGSGAREDAPVCIQFRQGHCTYGDRCQYRHEIREEDNMGPMAGSGAGQFPPPPPGPTSAGQSAPPHETQLHGGDHGGHENAHGHGAGGQAGHNSEQHFLAQGQSDDADGHEAEAERGRSPDFAHRASADEGPGDGDGEAPARRSRSRSPHRD